MTETTTAARWLAARFVPSFLFRKVRSYHLRSLFKDRSACETDPTLSVLTSLVRPGDIAFDVGANIGIFTRRLSELVGDLGHVWAFELVPDTFEILDYNMREFRNVSCRNYAISNKREAVGFHVPRRTDGVPDYYCAHVMGSGSLPALPIDEITASAEFVGRVDFIKIDVEGLEAEVIEGARNTLLRYRPSMIIESAPESPIFSVLERDGYEALAICADAVVAYSGQRTTNYAFVHRNSRIKVADLLAA